MTFRPLWKSIGKVLVGTAVMTATVLAGRMILVHASAHQRVADLLSVLVLIPVGILVYALTLWLVRVEGREELAGFLLKKFRPVAK